MKRMLLELVAAFRSDGDKDKGGAAAATATSAAAKVKQRAPTSSSKRRLKKTHFVPAAHES
jgi:hypothetical protein